MLRTYFPYHYVFIINLLCPVKLFTKYMFLSERDCYRQALDKEAIYFVDRSYLQDEAITYKQVTCYSRKGNNYCNPWTTDHTSLCTKSNRTKSLHIAKMPQRSFIVRCPVRQEDITYYHEARAFRKNSILEKSKILRVDSLRRCHCNWSDIKPNVSFEPPFAELSVNKPFLIRLAFKLRFLTILKIKLYLATNSNLIPICEAESDKFHPLRKPTIWCSLEKFIGCSKHSLVANLQSLQCINNEYKLNITIPKKRGRDLEIFENNFICNKYNDGVELVPVVFGRNHTYIIKNANNGVKRTLFNSRGIKLKGKDGVDIQIKVCKMDCICSQYITLKNCHTKQRTQKISQATLSVISVSIPLIIIVIMYDIIKKKTRNNNTEAEASTPEIIFDDFSEEMVLQPYEEQLAKECQTFDTVSKYKDEIFDQVDMPNGISL